MVTRGGSGQSVLAIPPPAWATTATTTAPRPCRRPVGIGIVERDHPVTEAMSRSPDGAVNPSQAANAPREAALGEPDADPDLARRWARKHLAQGDEVRVAAFVHPGPADHERLAEVADMGAGQGAPKEVRPSPRKARKTVRAGCRPARRSEVRELCPIRDTAPSLKPRVAPAPRSRARSLREAVRGSVPRVDTGPAVASKRSRVMVNTASLSGAGGNVSGEAWLFLMCTSMARRGSAHHRTVREHAVKTTCGDGTRLRGTSAGPSLNEATTPRWKSWTLGRRRWAAGRRRALPVSYGTPVR